MLSEEWEVNLCGNVLTSVELAGEREEICGRGEEEAQREEEIAEMRRED